MPFARFSAQPSLVAGCIVGLGKLYLPLVRMLGTSQHFLLQPVLEVFSKLQLGLVDEPIQSGLNHVPEV